MQCGGRPGLKNQKDEMESGHGPQERNHLVYICFSRCHLCTCRPAFKIKSLVEKIIEGKLCYRFPLFQFYLKDTDKKTWHEGRVSYFKKYLIKNLINFYNLRYEIIHNICLCLRFIVIIPKFYWIFY